MSVRGAIPVVSNAVEVLAGVLAPLSVLFGQFLLVWPGSWQSQQVSAPPTGQFLVVWVSAPPTGQFLVVWPCAEQCQQIRGPRGGRGLEVAGASGAAELGCKAPDLPLLAGPWASGAAELDCKAPDSPLLAGALGSSGATGAAQLNWLWCLSCAACQNSSCSNCLR